MSYKSKVRRLSYKIDRIERKCDRILSEILVLRHHVSRDAAMDSAIERLHRAARGMRRQCENERDSVLGMFNPKSARE